MKKSFESMILILLGSLLVLGCASNRTKDLGSYDENDNIKTMFKTYEFVSDYNCFYTGYIKSPEAIVGIKRDYNLVKSSGWGHVTNRQKFGPSSEKLKESVEAMINPGRPYGYNINAPSGGQIGVLYTKKWRRYHLKYSSLYRNNYGSLSKFAHYRRVEK